MSICQFDLVRVIQLISAPADHLIWSGSERPPHVGDTGVVVDTYTTGGPADAVIVVESVDATGSTLWLAEFHPVELEQVS